MRASRLLAPSLRLISAAFILPALVLCPAPIAHAKTSSEVQYGAATTGGAALAAGHRGSSPWSSSPSGSWGWWTASAHLCSVRNASEVQRRSAYEVLAFASIVLL